MDTPSSFDCLRIASDAVGAILISGDINDFVKQECASILMEAVPILSPYVLEEEELKEALISNISLVRKKIPINSALSREDRIAVVRTIVRVAKMHIIETTARI